MFKKTIASILSEAGIQVPSGITKSFTTAMDGYEAASKARLESISALDAFEKEATTGIEGLKRELALNLAAGLITEGAASAAMREARDAEDLADIRRAGVHQKVATAEEAYKSTAIVLADAHAQLRLAIESAVRKLLIEKARPVCAAVRKCLAVDAALGAGLGGLSRTVFADPQLGELQVGEYPGANFDWQGDPEAAEIASALSWLGTVLHEAGRAALTAADDLIAREAKAADINRQGRLSARDHTFGTSASVMTIF